MLEETAEVVVQVRPGRVRVKAVRSAACDSCASAAVCQVMAGGKEMLVEARDNLGVKVGQQVIIGIHEKTLLLATFMVYILPLGGLFIGISLIKWLAPSLSQAWNVVAGFLGLAFGFIITYFYSRNLKTNRYLPVVVRIVEEGT